MIRTPRPYGFVPAVLHTAKGFRTRAGRALTWLLGMTGSIVLLAIVLGPVALWATPAVDTLRGKDRADAVNATRQILLASVAGLALLTGAGYTARTFYLGRRGQLTDRYAKAIGLLASDKLAERVGAVYALEHLMIESERDHSTVVEVLAAFVRDRTTPTTAEDAPWDAEHNHEGGNDRPRVETDVQAALTVIGRRPRRPEPNAVDLSRADLCGADLSGLNFDGTWFWRTKLRSTIMLETRLNETNLCWAQLQEATLTGVQMKGAALDGAQLQNSVLYEAQLSTPASPRHDFRVHASPTPTSRARASKGHNSRVPTCSFTHSAGSTRTSIGHLTDSQPNSSAPLSSTIRRACQTSSATTTQDQRIPPSRSGQRSVEAVVFTGGHDALRSAASDGQVWPVNANQARPMAPEPG